MSAKSVVLVTGASSGIGAVYADRFAKRGHDLVLVARDGARMEALATRLREETGVAVDVVPADLTAAGDVARVEARLRDDPRIGILVNNAGMGSPSRGDLLDLRPQAYDAVLDTNLRGTFFLTQAVARRMLAGRSAGPRSIVTVSSVSAELASVERGEYCLSKAGLGMLTRLFALRLAAEPGRFLARLFLGGQLLLAGLLFRGLLRGSFLVGRLFVGRGLGGGPVPHRDLCHLLVPLGGT